MKSMLAGVLICGFAWASPAFAQQVRVTGSRVNVRLEPSTASGVITTVNVGTVLEILDKEGDWYFVQLPQDTSGSSRTGYIAARFVEVVPAVPPPAETPPLPPVRDPEAPPSSPPLVTPQPSASDEPQPAQPAAAAPQGEPPARGRPRRTAASATQTSSGEWTFLFPAFIGHWTDAYYSGTTMGGGIARSLSERIELQGDVSYSKWSDGYEVRSEKLEPSHFLLFSGNIIYNIGRPRLVPFAGGGVVVVRSVHGGFARTGLFASTFPGYTETAVTAQALGGVKVQINSRFAIRGEGRFHFFAMDETLASLSFLLGVSFCPRCGR